MARRGFGASTMVAIPQDLRPFFTVSEVAATIHGRSRHPKKAKKPHHLGMHGHSRAPDPWHHKGSPSGR